MRNISITQDIHWPRFVTMEMLSEIGVPTMAMASALSVAAGAYLNAKLAISTDLATISNDKAFVKRVGERIAKLDGSATIYKMLERVVEVEGQGAVDALWFEQKVWSYSHLKDCKYCLCRKRSFRAPLIISAVVDRMAALLKGREINAGDTVGVFASNSPEMVVILYALSKLGAVAAMINTNLRGKPCIRCGSH